MTRAEEVNEYVSLRGKHEAAMFFKITVQTVERYVRHFKNPTLRKKRTHKVVNNVLVIGDLHEPFTLPGYLEFCQAMYKKHNCNRVVFIGDIIDNHFSSFHDANPDGHSAGRELELAKAHIKLWYEAFPYARVCIGNHDLIPERKNFNAGLSSRWLKTISEVLETPNWDYAEEFTVDGVTYCHGTGRKARQRMKQDLVCIAQGHYHSESYIEYIAGSRYLLFALQVGSGLDKDSYAAAYGRHFSKPHVNVGIIKENGRLPILEYMPL